ncbi:bacillithiol biosynthesis cysteine-adding enzyme BshC [Simkania negevensis]|uniref:Bacillithiol biosynthesis cysteine-adding enzyme BshC n=1 Tax=Simkania negevensis TaxID=83561 RepID=A0ABS3ARM6_9BACT|nr:bacillithiol biosynthesis cysteine-adding enzyme BshC [Simkania negevensis]
MKIVVKETPSLYQPSALDRFFAIPPNDRQAEKKAVGQLVKRSYPRKELADILARYNAEIGNSSSHLDRHLNRVAADSSYFVVTGQQIGLMGGPLYTIYKAVSCLLLAKACDAIPLFWLATEDHDVEEASTLHTIDGVGNIMTHKLHWKTRGFFVEDLPMGAQQEEKLLKILQDIGLDAMEWTERFVGISYSQAMVRVLVTIFQDTGLLFIEPKELRQLAVPFFTKEITDCKKISSILTATTQQILAMGGKAPLAIDAGSNLFYKTDNRQRKRVVYDGGSFRVGDEKIQQKELLDQIDHSYHRFSTNAAARAVLQSSVIPTIAYVAGPAEMAYYRQLHKYHDHHNVPMPWIVPRISATLLTDKIQALLDKCNLSPWEPTPSSWRHASPNIEKEIEALVEEWKRAARKIFPAQDIQEAVARFVDGSTVKLSKKLAKAYAQNAGIPQHSLHYIHNAISPADKPQERIFNFFQFQLATKEKIVHELLSEVDWACRGHHYCFLKS